MLLCYDDLVKIELKTMHDNVRGIEG